MSLAKIGVEMGGRLRVGALRGKGQRVGGGVAYATEGTWWGDSAGMNDLETGIWIRPVYIGTVTKRTKAGTFIREGV